MNLSRYEKETIILFNEEEAEAEIYTHNVPLKQKLRQMAKESPKDCSFVERNTCGGETYRISKKLVQIRKPYSEARRQADRERALAQHRVPPNRQKKEQTSSESE